MCHETSPSSFSLRVPLQEGQFAGGGHSRPVGGGHFEVPFPKLWDPSEGHSDLAGQVQGGQPFRDENPWVSLRFLPQGAPPRSPSTGPPACAQLRAARLLSPALRGPPRGGLGRRGGGGPGRAGWALTRRAPPGSANPVRPGRPRAAGCGRARAGSSVQVGAARTECPRGPRAGGGGGDPAPPVCEEGGRKEPQLSRKPRVRKGQTRVMARTTSSSRKGQRGCGPQGREGETPSPACPRPSGGAILWRWGST